MDPMFDPARLISAAELLNLASTFPGDAQYILAQTVARYQGAHFARIEGDLKIATDLRLDWDAAPWRGTPVCGLVVEGDLMVAGSLSNFDLSAGPVLLVLGNVHAECVVQSGATWLIGGDMRVQQSFFGVYNDGYVHIGGDLVAEAVLNHDHHLDVVGQIMGRRIDQSHGHPWLVAAVVDEEGEVDWDALREHALQQLPLTLAQPRWIDIRAAAEDPSPELLAIALTQAADLELRDDFGNTPLLLAVLSGRLSNVRALLAAGAWIAAVNDRGEGLAHLLSYSRDQALIDLVLAYAPPLELGDARNRTPMKLALQYRNLVYVRALHARGVGLPAPDRTSDGYPYSLLLAEADQIDLLAFLIANGVPVDWQSSDFLSEGYSLLHVAASRGGTESVYALLGAGVPVDVRDACGRSPLRSMLDLAPRILQEGPAVAAAIAQALLDAGADPLARADDGLDSLDAALATQDVEVLRRVFAAVACRPLEASRKEAVLARLQSLPSGVSVVA